MMSKKVNKSGAIDDQQITREGNVSASNGCKSESSRSELASTSRSQLDNNSSNLTHNGRKEINSSHRSQVRRAAKRASYDRQKIYGLIDSLKTGHLSFVEAGEPRSIPMTLWRWQDNLYFHVLNGGRIARILAESDSKTKEACQADASVSRLLCISFARTTEWVMSKSAFHHSANYQSVVLFGRATEVKDREEFNQAFRAIINQLEPDRWDQVREPSEKERKATALFRVPVEEGAHKCRSGGPNEEPEDLALPVWHGTLAADSTSGSAANGH